jgi:molybdopterin converting factor small subunit
MHFRLWRTAWLTLVGVAWISSAAWGQHPSKTGPKYDTANEVKIKGVIEEVREVPGEFEGTQLVVKTDTKTVLVHVAPGEFLKEMDTSFKKGDEVAVVGAKAPNTTEEEILAREITDGNNTATLRDDKGIPIWAGWKAPKSTAK